MKIGFAWRRQNSELLIQAIAAEVGVVIELVGLSGEKAILYRCKQDFQWFEEALVVVRKIRDTHPAFSSDGDLTIYLWLKDSDAPMKHEDYTVYIERENRAMAESIRDQEEFSDNPRPFSSGFSK